MLDTRAFDVVRYLARLPLFSDIGDEALQHLAAGSSLRSIERGQLVFRQGEPCEHFHVVAGGQVKLFVLSPAGAEKVIEIVSPGHSFAEALMFTDRPYILNAQALTDSLVLSIGKAAVVTEIESDPRFAMRMLAGISRRLHGLVLANPWARAILRASTASRTAPAARSPPCRCRSARPRSHRGCR